MRQEGLGSVGEKDQAAGQSRYIALHLLGSMSDSSGYKIIGLLSLGEWGLAVCLIIINLMVTKTNNR